MAVRDRHGSVVVAALTGRRDQLAVLRAAVAEVAGSVPGAVLLTGLPGVGKTRLGREALPLAADAGFATFTGRAHNLGRGLAYAPLLAAFVRRCAMRRQHDARR